MNKFYLIVVSALFFNFSFANPVLTAKQNGSWSNKKTWDKDRTPIDGDTVVIPASRTVTFDDWFTTETLKNVYIKVSGSLKLDGFWSALSLDNKSTIVINSGGNLTSSGAWQAITLGGQQIFASSFPSIVGPQMASPGTNGFIAFSNPLPVKFLGFSAVLQGSDVLVQWSTSEEINASMYQVERSEDGVNWGTIAYVAAVGNSSAVNNYSYTDKNLSSKIAYYRIKQVDADGKSTLTAVKSIRQNTLATAAAVNIASIQNKVVLQFPHQVKGKVVVRFISLSGKVADEQNISSPVGQVVLNAKLTGIYIISVSNGSELNQAKQVML
jgi:hypothetical protein